MDSKLVKIIRQLSIDHGDFSTLLLSEIKGPRWQKTDRIIIQINEFEDILELMLTDIIII